MHDTIYLGDLRAFVIERWTAYQQSDKTVQKARQRKDGRV